MINALRLLAALVLALGGVGLGTSDEPASRGKSLPEWLKQLKSDDVQEKMEAVGVLSDFGPRARAAVPDLIRLLKTTEADQRATVVLTLGKIGPLAKDAAPLLLDYAKDYILLPDENQQRDQRTVEITALARMGAAAGPALLKGLAHKEANCRAWAALLVGHLPAKNQQAIAALKSALKDKDVKVQVCVCQALVRQGAPPGDVIDTLIGVLESEVEGARAEAAQLLGRLGKEAAVAAPALGKALLNGTPPVQQQAGRALARFGPKARDVLPELIESAMGAGLGADFGMQALANLGQEGLDALLAALPEFSKTSDTRAQFAAVIGYFGPKAVPLLLKRLADNDAATRRTVMLSLQSFVRLDDVEIPTEPLRKALKDTDPWVRLYAAQALTDLGGKAKELAPVIIPLTLEMDLELKTQAIGELGALADDHPEALGALTRAMKDQDVNVALTAIQQLHGRKAQADLVAPHMAEALAHQDESIRSSAATYFQSIGAKGKPAALSLRLACLDNSPQVRQAALQALFQADPKSKETMEVVKAGLQSQEIERRNETVMLVDKFEARRAEIVPLLVEMLRAKEPENNKQQIVEVLSRMKEDAKAAVPVLLAFEDNLEGNALNALRLIGKAAAPGLRDGLKDENVRVRIKAAQLLYAVDADAKPAHDLLVKLLKHDDPKIRGQAMQALGSHAGPQAKESIAALKEMVTHKDREIRLEVVHALSGLGKEAAPALRLALKDESIGIRLAAVRVLAAWPDQDKAIAPILREALLKAELEHRREALDVLARVDVKPWTRELLVLLRDKEDGVRSAAAWQLGYCRHEKKRVLPALKKALTDGNPDVRLAAADAMTRLDHRQAGEAIPLLIEALRFGEVIPGHGEGRLGGMRGRHKRVEGAGLLEWVAAGGRVAPRVGLEFGEGDPAESLARLGTAVVPHLLPLLEQEGDPRLWENVGEPELRHRILAILGRIGPEAKEAIPAIIKLAQTEEEDLRDVALGALVQLGPTALPAVPDLIAMQERHNAAPYGRGRAPFFGGPLDSGLVIDPMGQRASPCMVLAAIGPKAKGALPVLRATAKDRANPEYLSARWAIWKIHGDAKEIMTLLEKDLAGADKPTKYGIMIDYEVLALLAELGPQAKSAVPVLHATLKSALTKNENEPEDPYLILSLLEALGRIGPDARNALPEIHKELKKDRPHVLPAAHASWRIAKDAARVVPLLKEILEAPDNAGADPRLIEFLGDLTIKGPGGEEVPSQHAAAAQLAALIGPPAKDLAEPLRKLLDSDNALLRLSAAEALCRIQDKAGAELDDLRRSLDHRASDVRESAVRALGRLGPLAKDAEASLRTALDDYDPAVRRAAAEALASGGALAP